MAAEYEVNIKINTQQIERELKKVDKAVENIGKAKGGSRASGLGLMPNDELKRLQQSRIYLGQAVQSIDKLAKIQDRRARSLNKINELEAKGLNVGRLRKQLAKATTEQSARRFGSAEKEFRVLEKSIRLEQSKLRILKAQREGFPASPIRGTATMMGSPAQIAASGRQLASPIRGGVGFPGSPRALEEAAKGAAAVKRIGMDLMRLAGTAGRLASRTARFIDSSNLRQRNASTLPSSEMLQARARKTGQEIVQLKTREAALQDRIAQALQRSAERSASVRREAEQTVPALRAARAAMPFDDSFGPQRPSKTSAPLTGLRGGFGGKKFGGFDNKRAGDIALGAGFPLLFGGGPGAVIGGALGGATGGGLAAQIALSAIGQQIDAFVARIAVVGSAFNEITLDLGTVAKATGIANTEIQAQLEKIEQYGSAAEAAKFATELLASRVGGPGRDALKKFGEDAVTLGNNLNIIFTQILANIAKIAGPLLEKLANFAGDISAQGAFRRAEGLTGVDAAVQKFVNTRQTRQDVKNLRKELLAAGFTGELPAESTVSANKFAKQFATERGKELLKTPELKIQEFAEGIKTPEQLRAADKVARDSEAAANALKSAQQKLEIMRQEGSLAKELKQIDFDRAAEIEKINKLEHATGEAREDAIKATNELFDAQKGEAIGKALAEDLRIAQELQKAQKDTLRPLEDQKKLLEAKLKGNEEEVRLQLEIESIMRSVEGLNKKDVENVVRGNALLREQVAVVERLDQVYASIGQSITSGIVDSLTAAVEGTKSLADVASQTLRQVGNILLQFGVQSALGGIPGLDRFFPGKALGGAVGANKPYMVGERGPELFVPGAQGNIVPNHAMGSSNIVVNVDASGSEVQGDQPNAKALGAAIGVAVQAELVKQKRPGGLLA